MDEIKRFQVRGIPGSVARVSFNGRIADYWSPKGGSKHLLIAHDGQNIFDPSSATFLRQTWRMAQTAIRVFQEFDLQPPIIVGVFHSSNKKDPHGRIKDLTPESAFRDGIIPTNPISEISLDDLRGNNYLDQICHEIVPKIISKTNSQFEPRNTAMIGSSMGGLATLNAFSRFPDVFDTCLSFSPHWTLAGQPLVENLIGNLPRPERKKLWMSRGTKGLDASYEPFQNRADQLVRNLGWNSNFSTKVYHRTGHNERSWASYLDQALKFWIN
jgi:predicted alpha/beta superfamily hydrolase